MIRLITYDSPMGWRKMDCLKLFIIDNNYTLYFLLVVICNYNDCCWGHIEPEEEVKMTLRYQELDHPGTLSGHLEILHTHAHT